MTDEPVRVIAYAGGRGEERPRAFFLGEEEVKIVRVVRAWIGEEGEGRERKRFFRVKGDDGAGHLLYYDERLRVWFLSPGDPPTP
jgi:hypothetical protein